MSNDKFKAFFDKNYLQTRHEFIISAVVEAELKALALKRKWGNRKNELLLTLLERYMVYPVKTAKMINAYAQLDAYSQGELEGKPLPKGMSARNMGKNDLWVAATTLVADATLVTTDKDFEHLKNVYFPIDLLDIKDFT